VHCTTKIFLGPENVLVDAFSAYTWTRLSKLTHVNKTMLRHRQNFHQIGVRHRTEILPLQINHVSERTYLFHFNVLPRHGDIDCCNPRF